MERRSGRGSSGRSRSRSGTSTSKAPARSSTSAGSSWWSGSAGSRPSACWRLPGRRSRPPWRTPGRVPGSARNRPWRPRVPSTRPPAFLPNDRLGSLDGPRYNLAGPEISGRPARLRRAGLGDSPGHARQADHPLPRRQRGPKWSRGPNFVNLRDAGRPGRGRRPYEAEGPTSWSSSTSRPATRGEGSSSTWVRRTAEVCFMPVTVGGGIRNARRHPRPAQRRGGQGVDQFGGRQGPRVSSSGPPGGSAASASSSTSTRNA